ncbi:MAG: hypothetical protein RXQ56_05100 [Thermoproteus sp.]|nr:MAG: hypothetical protein AT711_02360 [Thermoproteus sp. CIS_19]KUO88918.1 MAG: hypothetical protein AT715_02535 [Thermoproteus sp. JCHS_4]MCI4465249.1 hypothetical protein [Thermoproteus sp.]MDT7869745.1 hypothetical protein [Thermoproteus sp.]MDT7882442.1 hypothetical protein [Thermoproteus sp.]
MLAERLTRLKPLRVLVTIESGDPQLNRGAAEFLARALRGPLDVEANGLSVSLTFRWSLASKVAEMISSEGDSVLDFEIADDQVTIVTKKGLVATIRIDVRSNGYVSEVEGVVSIDRAPFEIDES